MALFALFAQSCSSAGEAETRDAVTDPDAWAQPACAARNTAGDGLGYTMSTSLEGRGSGVFHCDWSSGCSNSWDEAGQLGRLTHVRGDGWELISRFDALGRPYEQHLTPAGWRPDLSR